MNGAAVPVASRPSGVISALVPSSSPLKVGTTAKPDHRQLALLAIGGPRRDRVADLHIEVTRGPEPQRDLVRGARQPARLETDVERPAEVLDRVPVDLDALDRQRCARRVGHVADEGVVEHLVLEVLDRDIGDADVVRDGRAGGGADQPIEAGDEHQAGDDAGHARPSRR